MAPNVLLIICHDLGKRLGCYGVPHLKTPALDALANEGVVCDRHFATAPQCSPSRGSIMTGLYPHTHGLMGLVHRGWELPDTYPTLAQLLGRAGYETHLFGLQHETTHARRLGYQAHHQSRAPFTCERVGAEFERWLRSRPAASAPFFACLGFVEAHRDFRHPRYRPDDPAAVSAPAYLPDRPGVRADLADLHGMIFAIDRAVGRVLAALAESGVAANTLVVFTTDHGIAFPRAKCSLYDPGIESALILRWPGGIQGSRRYAHLLSNVDLLPTILACANQPAPLHGQGASFLPLLRGERYQERPEIFAEKSWHQAYDPMRAVRTRRFKYIRHFPGEAGRPPARRPMLDLPKDIERSPSRQALAEEGDPHLAPRPAEELYDLQADPDEFRNVIDDPDYAATAASLRLRLRRWMKETGDPLLHGFIGCPRPELQYATAVRLHDNIDPTG